MMEKRPSVAILYLCTGAYRVFWHDFYPNFRENFLPDCEKTFFVFTDADAVDYEENADVRRVYQKALPWPYSTMQRFDAFLGQRSALAGYDYLFFANANLQCTGPILAEEILPNAGLGQRLTVVCHLPYYGKNPIFHPYERRGKSRAGIPYNCGKYYVAGGLNGGEAGAYLALCRELKDRTDDDLRRGVIAAHHDESQLNRLVAEDEGAFRILPPTFCVPEETPVAGQRIRVLQKAHYIKVSAVKGTARPQNWFQRKWEAFGLNWLPYLWYARDRLLHRKLRPGR